MAIEVSANGEGVGRDTHVSVYIRIMHGEYDDMLRWPLHASVTIQLISQSGNEAHYAVCIAEICMLFFLELKVLSLTIAIVYSVMYI